MTVARRHDGTQRPGQGGDGPPGTTAALPEIIAVAVRLTAASARPDGRGRDIAAGVGDDDDADAIEREGLWRIAPRIAPELVNLAVQDGIDMERAPVVILGITDVAVSLAYGSRCLSNFVSRRVC